VLIIVALGKVAAYTIRRWVSPWSLAVGGHRLPGLWYVPGVQVAIMAGVTYLPFALGALTQTEPLSTVVSGLANRLRRIAPSRPARHAETLARSWIPRSIRVEWFRENVALVTIAALCALLYAFLIG